MRTLCVFGVLFSVAAELRATSGRRRTRPGWGTPPSSELKTDSQDNEQWSSSWEKKCDHDGDDTCWYSCTGYASYGRGYDHEYAYGYWDGQKEIPCQPWGGGDTPWDGRDPASGTGDKQCWCQSLTCKDGSAPIMDNGDLTCGCSATHVTGHWSAGSFCSPGVTTHETWGLEWTSTKSRSSEWSKSTTASMEVGFEVFGIGPKLSVSSTVSRSVAQSSSEALSSSKTTQVDHQCDTRPGTLWQWTYTIEHTCGGEAADRDQSYVVTDGEYQQPCCLPGWFQDNNNPGTSGCVDGPTLCAAAPAPAPESGDAIRPSADSSLCFDLPGGGTGNGNRLWLWSCSGLAGQRWNWVDGAIHPGSDNSKCLDVPGGDFSNGNLLQLWDCNGLPGQDFGYDGDSQTIYLGSSTSTDATMCVDVAGGEGYDGASVQLWSCNGLPNQQWLLGSGGQSLAIV